MAINNNRYYTPDYTYSRPSTPTNTTTTNSGKKKSSGTTTQTQTTTQQPTPIYVNVSGDDGGYDDRMARIEEAYARAAGLLEDNYNSAVSRLKAAKKNSTNEINVDAERSLREAYVNNMMNRKNLDQRLSAMGYNGGATETTMSRLANQYGNARTDINNTRNGNLADLNEKYADNLAAALQSYNSALSNLEMQRLQMELSLEPQTTSGESLASALEQILKAQGEYQLNPTSANNTVNKANVTQAQAADTNASNYAKVQQQIALQAAQGATPQAIRNYAFQAYDNGMLDLMTLAQIRQQYGI